MGPDRAWYARCNAVWLLAIAGQFDTGLSRFVGVGLCLNLRLSVQLGWSQPAW